MRGFVYSEHRSIAGAAIAVLTPERAATLARLWGLARDGHDVRLCAKPWTGAEGLERPCVDFAAWSAIGGDHSCSPADLLDAVLEGDLILRKNAIEQALGLRFQFGAGFDKPLEAIVIDPPGATVPSLQTRYFGYVRLVFEGRRYL